MALLVLRAYRPGNEPSHCFLCAFYRCQWTTQIHPWCSAPRATRLTSGGRVSANNEGSIDRRSFIELDKLTAPSLKFCSGGHQTIVVTRGCGGGAERTVQVSGLIGDLRCPYRLPFAVSGWIYQVVSPTRRYA